MNFREDTAEQNRELVYGGAETDSRNETKMIHVPTNTHNDRGVFRKGPRIGATSVTEQKPLFLCFCPTCERSSLPRFPLTTGQIDARRTQTVPSDFAPATPPHRGGPHHGTTRQGEISGAPSGDRETKGTSGTSEHIYNESQHQRRQRQAAVREPCSKSDRCFLHRASL